MPSYALILILLAVSILLLPTQRDQTGHNITPFGLRMLSVAISLIGDYFFFTILLRSFAWMMGKQIHFGAVNRSLVSYIGPGIATAVCVVLFYFAIPLIVFGVAGKGMSRTDSVALISTGLTYYGGAVWFLLVFSVPILILERKVGFINIIKSLRTSIEEPILAAVLVLPGYAVTLIGHLAIGNTSNSVGFRLLSAAVSNLCMMLSLFVYAALLKTNEQDRAGEP